jgi:replicative DNA helicase
LAIDLYDPVVEAENSMLGAIFLEPSNLTAAMGKVSPADLFQPQTRLIYATMIEMQKEGQKIDPVTVIQKVGKEHKNFLMDCCESVAFISNLDAYCDKVIEERMRRESAEKTSELFRSTLEREDISQLQSKANEVIKCFECTAKTEATTAKDGILRFFQEKGQPKEYISTGFSQIDECTFVEQGDYIVIGGRPSSGKTAFALNLSANLAKNKRVVFFTLETSAEKIIDRMFTAFAGLNFSRVKKHTMTEEEWIRAGTYSKDFCELQFEVVGAAGRSVNWIHSQALSRKADIVFVDYLGLIKAEGKSRYEKVTNISVDLHTMAQSSKITVFALSQLNRNGTGVPSMEDLRESGQIEQDADIIILLHNDKEKGDYFVDIAKNKEGKTGVLQFDFDGSKQKFFALEAGR